MIYDPNPTSCTLHDWLLRLNPNGEGEFGNIITKRISYETFKAIYEEFFANKVVSQKID